MTGRPAHQPGHECGIGSAFSGSSRGRRQTARPSRRQSARPAAGISDRGTTAEVSGPGGAVRDGPGGKSLFRAIVQDVHRQLAVRVRDAATRCCPRCCPSHSGLLRVWPDTGLRPKAQARAVASAMPPASPCVARRASSRLSFQLLRRPAFAHLKPALRVATCSAASRQRRAARLPRRPGLLRSGQSCEAVAVEPR